MGCRKKLADFQLEQILQNLLGTAYSHTDMCMQFNSVCSFEGFYWTSINSGCSTPNITDHSTFIMCTFLCVYIYEKTNSELPKLQSSEYFKILRNFCLCNFSRFPTSGKLLNLLPVIVHFLQVTTAIIKIVQKPWDRCYIDGQPHKHGNFFHSIKAMNTNQLLLICF